MATMTPEQFDREKNYGAALAIAREMLKKDLINEDEFARLEAIFREKYKPLIGSLYPILRTMEQHGHKIEPFAPVREAPKSKRNYTRKQKPVVEEAPAVEVEAEAEAALNPESEHKVVPEPVSEQEVLPATEAIAEPIPVFKADTDISEEDMQALLHSLVLLDRAGNASAKQKLAQLKRVLVS